MNDMNINDFDIQALVDNELSYEREKVVRLAISQNKRYKQRYEKLIKQKKGLIQYFYTQV